MVIVIAGPFDILNYQHEIRVRGGETTAQYDPTTRVLVGPSTTGPTVITGHFSNVDRNQQESVWSKSTIGPVEGGSMRFYTYDAVAKGDIIEVDQDSGATPIVKTYRVLETVKRQDLMQKMLGGTLRTECEIKEVPE